MRPRHIVTSAIAAALAAAAGVTAATPASAADQNLTVTCPGDNSVLTTEVVLAPGDTLTLTPLNCDTFGHGPVNGSLVWVDDDGAHNVPDGASGSAYTATGWVYSVTYTAPSTPWSGYFSVGRYMSVTSSHRKYFVRVCAGGVCPTAAAPVPDWVQAVGRAGKDATCPDGWDPSWQEWAQPVTGGWVCTRSIPSVG